MYYWLIVFVKKMAADILYEEMDDGHGGFRSLLAETYWEDSGLYTWTQERFASQTALAKWDADCDNPWRLV